MRKLEQAAFIPVQKCPAKPHMLAVNFAIIPEPSGWVKSVTANKVVNYPRFQLSQAPFSVIFH